MAKLWRKPFDTELKAPRPSKITIEKEKCKGCGYCTEFCPRDALVMSQEINSKGYTLAAVADETKCLGCGLCQVICPEFAITVRSDNDDK
ncbi:MAG: 4Fe-4S binding protein [Dehalococcoidales bacterium]|nr:4Fe-4S binding protein [Dehalococcoidales bacterium]